MAHHQRGGSIGVLNAAGTAQYHINADIVYALRKYVQATGDEVFLRDFGAEMLVETARLWLELGFYSDAKGGKFCINGVTGPNEYNAVVNNNAYTNLMARENLRYATEVVESLRRQNRMHTTRLHKKRRLSPPRRRHGFTQRRTCMCRMMKSCRSFRRG